jgi:hypothetical protein
LIHVIITTRRISPTGVGVVSIAFPSSPSLISDRRQDKDQSSLSHDNMLVEDERKEIDSTLCLEDIQGNNSHHRHRHRHPPLPIDEKKSEDADSVESLLLILLMLIAHRIQSEEKERRREGEKERRREGEKERRREGEKERRRAGEQERGGESRVGEIINN